MPKLFCDAKTCFYHQDEYCTKDRIKVCNCQEHGEHETMCDSYKLKKDTDNRKELFEFASFGTPNAYSSVSCNVLDCIHNQHEMCKATSIKVDGKNAKNKHETICTSYATKIKL